MEPLAPARHIAGARHRTSPPALRARPSNDARLAEGGLELAYLGLPTHEDPARKGIQADISQMESSAFITHHTGMAKRYDQSLMLSFAI